MTPGKLTIDQWGGMNAEDGKRLLLTGVSLSLGNDPRLLAEANSERVVACWNACTGLTPEQVAAIPRLVKLYTSPGFHIDPIPYDDLDAVEVSRIRALFPRRRAGS